MTALDEILINTEILLPSACMLWRGTVRKNGYPQMRWNGGKAYVTRVVWQLAHPRAKPLTPQDSIIHDRRVCVSRSCVNPSHLVRVPRAQQNRFRDIDKRTT